MSGWLGVVSREHVVRGVGLGIAQLRRGLVPLSAADVAMIRAAKLTPQ